MPELDTFIPHACICVERRYHRQLQPATEPVTRNVLVRSTPSSQTIERFCREEAHDKRVVACNGVVCHGVPKSTFYPMSATPPDRQTLTRTF